jgi:hypothetical protein
MAESCGLDSPGAYRMSHKNCLNIYKTDANIGRVFS